MSLLSENYSSCPTALPTVLFGFAAIFRTWDLSIELPTVALVAPGLP
jgi:hypothetical protein